MMPQEPLIDDPDDVPDTDPETQIDDDPDIMPGTPVDDV
jgi:hypothetical protein